jgi:sucrose phosphorylase
MSPPLAAADDRSLQHDAIDCIIGAMRNQVQLITYVDRLGGTFAGLQQLLTGPLAGLFGGIHVLPFFHPIDGADAGFDPIDHTQVDHRIGNWSSVKSLAGGVDVMADVIVNHMSSQSPQFLDFSEHGSASRYADMFLTRDKVFRQGATEQQLRAIYRPRPGLPFSEVVLKNGERRVLWTTFTPQQIDIDVRHPEGADYLMRILRQFAANDIRMVRLDAVGYAIKTPGTSSFMTPETFEFIDEFAAKARGLGIEVLVEVHSYYRRQIEIAKRVDWVYDFALPPLVLHAFEAGTSRYLRDWIAIRPRNAVTVLDTHDGIGVVDIGADPADRAGCPGLVPPEQIDRLVESIHRNSEGQSREATGSAASNLDLYQVNCTFFDAMGRDELRYLLSRAIQYFLPGVPQVYYVGLLAGYNDMKLLARSRVGRDINRHHYSPAEIQSDLRRPVVRDLMELTRLRNGHAAFGGSFQRLDSPEEELVLRWSSAGEYAQLRVNLVDASYHLEFSSPQGSRQLRFESQANPR